MACFTLPLAINTVLSLQSAVILNGTVLSNPKRFNLVTNDTNLPLHVNPRWNQGKIIVINHKVNGKWGSNKTVIPFPANFGSPGSSFTMSASISSTSFAVSINDQVIAHFPNIVGVDELKIFRVGDEDFTNNPAICAQSLQVK